MAGTATTWNTTNVAQNAGQLWYDLAIPGAGARITLDADGTPDATANPNAKHAGATTEGSRVMAKPAFTNYNVDEFPDPIITNLDTTETAISCALVGVTKSELAGFLLPGMGTYATAAGYKQVTFGRIAIVYSSVAVIFPLIEDTTKYGIFNLYKAINDAGLEFDISRVKLGSTPVNLRGYAITTRAATDTTGNFWKQIT